MATLLYLKKILFDSIFQLLLIVFFSFYFKSVQYSFGLIYGVQIDLLILSRLIETLLLHYDKYSTCWFYSC